jgi:hypothetical protein
MIWIDWLYKMYEYIALLAIILYIYMISFVRTMKQYKESGYTLTWSQFLKNTFYSERLYASFFG